MLSTRWLPQPSSGWQTIGVGQVADAEWHIVLSGGPHVLIEGPKSAIQQTICRLTAELPEGASYWSAGLTWPSGPRTLIIEDVAALGPRAQHELLERIQSGGASVQIVSTSFTPLYNAVLRGAFRSELYYHLNTLRIEVR